MNKQRNCLILVVCITIFLICFALSACNKDETPTQPPLDEIAAATIIKPIFDVNPNDPRLNHISGIVRDENYQVVPEVQIFFGENDEFVQETDADGRFDFYFVDPQGQNVNNQVEYLSVNPDKYKGIALVKSFHQISDKFLTNEFESFVVIVDKDSDIDLYDDLLYWNTWYNRNYDRQEIIFTVLIATSGINLPAGYRQNNSFLTEGVTTGTISEYILNDVNVYVNGELCDFSESQFIWFDYLIKGTKIRFEREGFSFSMNTSKGADRDDEDTDYAENGVFEISSLPSLSTRVFATATEPFDPDILMPKEQ